MNYAAVHNIAEQEYTPATVMCDWRALKLQLMLQWERITAEDLEDIGPDRHRIALLIESRYGVAFDMVEKYLSNFERILPLAANIP